ncbi:chromosomal replication initiator protein DnaA [Magnetovirga frankeli]|uniref:chromosomal replication initiator protein DnaA n=1 Tax=Magnetovirga frankeli TaxID=947516 RepID=UPI001292F114|nr:chromosomal replication initiator protein DnaA [gamma proteobacterium SS-5]
MTNSEEKLCWQQCQERLRSNLSAQLFNTWILPLQAVTEPGSIILLAPNRFVLDWVSKEYFSLIKSYIADISHSHFKVRLEIGSTKKQNISDVSPLTANDRPLAQHRVSTGTQATISNLNKDFSFSTFVEGKSNQLARAAAVQIAENPGTVYNPLFVYGGTGLGKTHLLHAIGNALLAKDPGLKVCYLYATGFINEMVNSLQQGNIEQFKKKYRDMNALLIDDVQFFANKEKTQEEFFHTFNSLFESRQQIVLTSDKYPKELNLEDRLKSRFGWGLVVRVEPPDLETRVAILKKKSIDLFQTDLPDEVAFFIGKRFQANIRDVEGALRRVIASTKFTGQEINLETTRRSLRDMLAAQDKLVTIGNIQKTVAEFYGIRTSDLSSNSRSRNIARPRQIAMALSRELTNQSMPEIGKSFGGRDHTTVLYAVRKVDELRGENSRIDEDYNNLLRTLTS